MENEKLRQEIARITLENQERAHHKRQRDRDEEERAEIRRIQKELENNPNKRPANSMCGHTIRQDVGGRRYFD